MQERVIDAIKQFQENPHHPGLRVRKMSGHKNIWDGRVTRDYRFTFEVKKGICILRRVGPHSIEDKP